MKFHQSLRFRVIALILLFGTLLITLNAGITFLVMGKTFSRLVDTLMETEVDSFLYQYEQNRTAPLPHSQFVKMYKRIEEMPLRFQEVAKTAPPGVHGISGFKNRPPVHIAVIELPDQPFPYYMLFHGHEFFKKNAFLHPLQILMISLALLLVPAMLLGLFFSRMLLRPVMELMDKIKGLNPEKIPDQFSGKPSANEIGMLTSTLESTMSRIKEFIIREKQFTRDASHELRTPLTIIKGAVEIMEEQPEAQNNPLIKRPMARIAHSVAGMETTINTFLWLAREETEPPGTCRVEPVVKKAIADHQHLIKQKNIVVDLDVCTDKSLNVKEEILYIAISNLLRNAFSFTTQGAVFIEIADSYIEIRDTGMGIPEERMASLTQAHTKSRESNGFGLGLSIVSRLCTRYGWELNIESAPGQGTRVRILWKNQDK